MRIVFSPPLVVLVITQVLAAETLVSVTVSVPTMAAMPAVTARARVMSFVTFITAP
jgi:hypothetical protein